MREAISKRLARLKTRKGELRGQVKALRASLVRNVEHKVEMLNAQVKRVNAKIKELRGSNVSSQG